MSICNLIFSYPYANNVFIPHNQHGFYGLRQVLHFAPLKQCALIIIMWVLLHGIFRHCGFKVQSRYYLCEHISMMEDLIVQCGYCQSLF